MLFDRLLAKKPNLDFHVRVAWSTFHIGSGGVRSEVFHVDASAVYLRNWGRNEMSATLHERQCLEVLHSASVKEFKRQIVAFSQHLGFETVAAIVVTAHAPKLVEFQAVTNAPAAYVEEFHDLDHGDHDPVIDHCRLSSSPIVWDRQSYIDRGSDKLWEIQAPFGYRSGIAIGMHLGRGRHFVFGGNWSKDRCTSVPHFKAIAEDFLSFADHAQAAAFELCYPARPAPEGTSSLAAQELEVLRWTMDGLTSWHVADLMSISERHVTLLTRRAMQKLGCSSKYEAVLRAIKLGLINGV